ncbi:NAD(P)H-dependent oxidoreductase [Luteolibacter marinus]|uniref:NAD(P)H-dependent oxidoreductase n=1 Tax=Luteolibacter marinus TaxID=2776705 RepID=UPI0018683DCE|nr:NAD(P)H-dependent oxidoreductase [Luteolibacter marinus]
MTPSALLDSLNFRYATKVFDPTRQIPEEEWDVLEQALVLAPSSFGLQPWKFLVINDPDLRSQLRKHSWNQSQITDSSRLVVFLTRTDLTEPDVDRFMTRLAAVQGRDPETLDGYRNIVVSFAAAMNRESRHAWNARQTYIALGQFMTAAAIIGIDTCPIEGFDPAGYDEVLELAGTDYTTTVVCAAGYRSGDDKYASTPKARFPLEELIEHR